MLILDHLGFRCCCLIIISNNRHIHSLLSSPVTKPNATILVSIIVDVYNSLFYNITLDNFNGNQSTNQNAIQINAELTKIVDRLTVNKLSLNIKKPKLMIFCSKQRILKSTEIPNIIINHIPIERVTYFKFLGVIIDSNLTWSHHINHISNKLSRICGVLSRLKHYVPVLILKIIYNSLFLSHLNYGITAWGFNVGPHINTLQKKAIRYI